MTELPLNANDKSDAKGARACQPTPTSQPRAAHVCALLLLTTSACTETKGDDGAGATAGAARGAIDVAVAVGHASRAAAHAASGDLAEVVLEATILFPEGGGQPSGAALLLSPQPAASQAARPQTSAR